MKVRIVASSSNGNRNLQYASSYVVNNSICIDAGSLGTSGTPADQASIRHIFLTHCHMDHVASLPAFLENAFDPTREPISVYGSAEALDGLQRHVFNGVIWPDFVKITIAGHPLVKLVAIEEEVPLQIGPLTILPVAVHHVVPTRGYIVTDRTATVVFGADSGPTERIWQLGRTKPGPIAVFLEACFPDEMSSLATVSGHLTPTMFAGEVRKIPEASNIIATHIKASFRDRVVEELTDLEIPGLVIGVAEHDYSFGETA